MNEIFFISPSVALRSEINVPCTVIPPNSRFLGLRKGPRVWKPRIWVHIYVVKVKKGAEPFSKVHFLGDFEVRCSQMDVLPNKNAT